MVVPERWGRPAAEDGRAVGRRRLGDMDGWCGLETVEGRGFGCLMGELALARAWEVFLLLELLRLGFEFLVGELRFMCALLEVRLVRLDFECLVHGW